MRDRTRSRHTDAGDLPRLAGDERGRSAGSLEQHVPNRIGTDTCTRRRPGVFAEHPQSQVSGGDNASQSVARRRRRSCRQVAPPSGLQRYSVRGLRRNRARTGRNDPKRSRAPTKRFALGFLRIPEEGDDLRLFEALVTAAAEAKSRRQTAHLDAFLRGAPAGRDPWSDQVRRFSNTSSTDDDAAPRRLPLSSVRGPATGDETIPPATTTSCRTGTLGRRSLRPTLISGGIWSFSHAWRQDDSGSCSIGVRCETTFILS